MGKNYWGYRIHNKEAAWFFSELLEGRLRQGWGYDPTQDLRSNPSENGARGNLPMFNRVKKGDILLIPHIQEPQLVSIVEATENWDTGYRFQIDHQRKDYGHIFPARFVKSFIRKSPNVSAELRRSLKTPTRFWSLNPYEKSIESLCAAPQTDLEKSENCIDVVENSVQNSFNELFDEKRFSEMIFNRFSNKFQNEEWEWALTAMLEALFPNYQVERVGGITEKTHGTDIKITIPGLLGKSYIIAIQVKDYKGLVSEDVIQQINKSDEAFNDENNLVVEKIVIVTQANKDENKLLSDQKGVRFIFIEELKELLAASGKAMLGLDLQKDN